MNLTLQRVLQIRDTIRARQADDQRARLRVEEVEMRALMATIHAANGNRSGAKQAQRWQLLKREARPVRMSAMIGQFPVGEEGLYTKEQVQQRQRELGLI